MISVNKDESQEYHIVWRIKSSKICAVWLGKLKASKTTPQF